MHFPSADTNHPNNLLKELNKCRLSETMCDVTILVGSRSFAAHKAVLACAAGYFQNLFLNTGLDAARTYVVDFITPANFEKILSFVYTSELFTDLINVGVIYEVAERLGMEDLLQACRAGGLSSTSSEQSHSLGDIRSGAEHFGPERNYLLHGDVAGGYKEDERNPVGEASQALPLMHPQQPPKTEQESDPGQFAPVTGLGAQPGGNVVAQTNSCPQYKAQSNGDYSKGGFFPTDPSLDVSTGSNSCPSNSDHSKEQGFEQMDELQLEDLGEAELHFEDAGEELVPSEEVIELSDDSEEELAFESDSRDSKAMPCQVCKKVLEPNIQLIRQHARDHVDLLTGNCKVCETHFQDRNSRHLAVHQTGEGGEAGPCCLGGDLWWPRRARSLLALLCPSLTLCPRQTSQNEAFALTPWKEGGPFSCQMDPPSHALDRHIPDVFRWQMCVGGVM
uniref:Zinc finger and BTB domain containing 39 n=1 Tax=Cyanoderma ruficeps TaxID=181631 RepID=A0A8C3NQQ0_9PASS